MKTKMMIAMMASTAAISTSSAFAQDVSDLGSITTVGASASHEKIDIGKERKPTSYGIFVDHGNKMTSTTGIIYDIGVDTAKSKTNNIKYSEWGIQGQAGYRASVTDNLTVDALGGIGYGEFKVKTQHYGKGTYKTPFLKAGVGANYTASSDTVLRAEAGYKYVVDGKFETKVANTNFSHDLDNSFNPYVELSVINTSSGVPIFASIYHEKTSYKVEYGNKDLKDTKAETGIKVGVAF